MANSSKRYGGARLVGGIRISHEFDNPLQAIEWHRKVTEGWRRHFVTDAMIYVDDEHRRPMLEGFDMLRFRCDAEDYGLHNAYDWANEGKYGYDIPGILIKPKDNGNSTI